MSSRVPAACTASSTPAPIGLTLKSSPKKVKIKVNGHKHRAPYRTELAKGTKLKLKAPKVLPVQGRALRLREVGGPWDRQDETRLKQKLKVHTKPIRLKAVYRRRGR